MIKRAVDHLTLLSKNRQFGSHNTRYFEFKDGGEKRHFFRFHVSQQRVNRVILYIVLNFRMETFVVLFMSYLPVLVYEDFDIMFIVSLDWDIYSPVIQTWDSSYLEPLVWWRHPPQSWGFNSIQTMYLPNMWQKKNSRTLLYIALN